MSHIHFAHMDRSGTFPIEIGVDVSVPEGAVALPRNLNVLSLFTKMLVKGEWQERPVSPAPEFVGNSFSVTNCPAGAFVEIIDADLRELLATIEATDGAVSCELPDPGRYQIIVDFGLPFLTSNTDFEVAA